MLEYAEDVNSTQAVSNGLELGYLVFLQKHENSNERCNHFALGWTHLAQGKSSQL
jgi:hypothetical protein